MKKIDDLTFKNMSAVGLMMFVSIFLPTNYLFSYSGYLVKALSLISLIYTVFGMRTQPPRKSGIPIFKLAASLFILAFPSTFISEQLFYVLLLSVVPLCLFSIFYERTAPPILSIPQYVSIYLRMLKISFLSWGVTIVLFVFNTMTESSIFYSLLIASSVISALLVLTVFSYIFYRLMMA